MEESNKLYSRIGIVKDNGMIDSVYCKYDGDIKNVGKLLYEYYNSRELVASLIKKGSIERLKKYDSRGIFNKNESREDTTIYFIRDRNYPSSLFKPVSNRNMNGFLRTSREIGAEYAYLFTDKDMWICIDMTSGEVDSLKNKLDSLESEESKVY